MRNPVLRVTLRAAILCMMVSCLGGAGCQSDAPADASGGSEAEQPAGIAPPATARQEGEAGIGQHTEPQGEARALFDGQTLSGWKATNFGGEGEIEVVNGELRLAMGYPMTGVTSVHESLPTTDYEISLEAMRVDGNDFFCGLTFPVDESHCSLVVGGSGGTVVGLSSIDGMDAANNETMRHMNFDNERWYRIRVRVEKEKISAWIDGALVVEQDISGKEITVRNEVLPSCPLGICGFQSACAIKNVVLRSLGGPSDKESSPEVDPSSAAQEPGS